MKSLEYVLLDVLTNRPFAGNPLAVFPTSNQLSTSDMQSLVRQKLLAAGFLLEAESQILRSPDDDRTKAFVDPEMKGKNTDKLALLFRKP